MRGALDTRCAHRREQDGRPGRGARLRGTVALHVSRMLSAQRRVAYCPARRFSYMAWRALIQTDARVDARAPPSVAAPPAVRPYNALRTAAAPTLKYPQLRRHEPHCAGNWLTDRESRATQRACSRRAHARAPHQTSASSSASVPPSAAS
eukprot:IDg4285t1